MVGAVRAERWLRQIKPDPDLVMDVLLELMAEHSRSIEYPYGRKRAATGRGNPLPLFRGIRRANRQGAIRVLFRYHRLTGMHLDRLLNHGRVDRLTAETEFPAPWCSDERLWPETLRTIVQTSPPTSGTLQYVRQNPTLPDVFTNAELRDLLMTVQEPHLVAFILVRLGRTDGIRASDVDRLMFTPRDPWTATVWLPDLVRFGAAVITQAQWIWLAGLGIEVRMWLAGSAVCPDWLLMALACSDEIRVRTQVSLNRSAPEEARIAAGLMGVERPDEHAWKKG